jgi:hypothetical protein
MDSLTLEEVKNAVSFAELEYKYIPNLIFTIGEKDRKGNDIVYKYSRVCARSIYYQIYHYHKRIKYKNTFYNMDPQYCKGQQYCGNTHIDVKKFNKLSYCRLHLVEGKCHFGVDCKYLHIFDDTKYTTPTTPLTTMSPALSSSVLNSIREYKPQPIQIPTFSECQECVNPLSTSETQQLNTNSSTSETQQLNTNSSTSETQQLNTNSSTSETQQLNTSSSTSETQQLNTSSSTSETQHRFSYPIEDYWKDLAKITAEKNQFERQLNNLYSEYQNEKIQFERQLNNMYSEYQIEIMKLKSELKNVTDKATRDREYYKEKVEYFQFLISRNSRYDERESGRESERERYRYY